LYEKEGKEEKTDDGSGLRLNLVQERCLVARCKEELRAKSPKNKGRRAVNAGDI
jgi:hypothetical protein